MSGRHRPPDLALPAIVAGGVVLRLLLLTLSEHELDADEALIGVMGFDILEGRSLPLFVDFTTYNGGGALEAYLSALGFAVLGDHAWVPKLCVLGIWTLAAVAFAALCRAHLERARAWLAVAVFSLGTPFFLEWSLKARGGYVETTLAFVALLLLADARRLAARPALVGGLFGLVCGLGLWMSEMILPLLPGALLWLWVRRPAEQRARLLGGLAAGLVVGILPLFLHDALHGWRHLRTSVLANFLFADGEPLSAGQIGASLRFVLGPAWPLAGAAVLVAAVRMARSLPEVRLEHVCALVLALYLVGYWRGGLRFMDVPPARVLFPLGPCLAVVIAGALPDLASKPRGTRAIVVAVVLAWGGAMAAPTVRWAASGQPREAGSWRGSWALVDAEGLRRELVARDVDIALTSYWTAWPLKFEQYRARRRDPTAPPLFVKVSPPPRPTRPGRNVAIVLKEGTPAYRSVDRALRGIPHERSVWNGYVIFHGIDSSAVHVRAGFPQSLVTAALPPPPAPTDGFN